MHDDITPASFKQRLYWSELFQILSSTLLILHTTDKTFKKYFEKETTRHK